MALAVGTSTFVVLVGQIELIAFLGQKINYVLGSTVVFLELLLTAFEFNSCLARSCLIQTSPLVLDHHGRIVVDTELDHVESVDVIQTHIIFMMVVLQNHRTLPQQVASALVVLQFLWFNDHGQRVLEAIQLFLHILTDQELGHKLSK